MSHTLETLDGRLNWYGGPHTKGISQPELSLDKLTHLCSQTALEMVRESIVFFSASTSRLVHANRAAANCLGYTQQQLRSMSLWDIAPQATRASLTEIYRRALRSSKHEARVRTVYRHRSGTLIPVHCSVRPLRLLPERIFVAVGQDASGRGSTNPQRLSAFRDSLTLLPNRAWLWRQLEREVGAARKSDCHFAVLFIDIDRFKDINDSYGHLAGDQVLQAVASRLTASVRPHDAVTRYGGDEFVVLLRDVDGDKDIRGIIDRIGRCLEVAGKCHGGKEWRARVTASIGVALSGGQAASSADTVERADRAMYRAKALGRNGQFVIDELPNSPSQSSGFGTEFAGRTRQFE